MADGQDFPFWEHVSSFDTNIHVAVLSKLPIVARRPHTNEYFLLDGKRFQVKRGFAELDIQAATNFTFTLFAAHLKSHLVTTDADEAEERLGEAKVLRGIIDERFKANPNAKLIVLGDLNDTKDSDSTKEIIGRGKFKLTDTRPAERNGDAGSAENFYHEPRNITWTLNFAMNIHEYQAKQLLAKYGVAVPLEIPAKSLAEVRPAAEKIVASGSAKVVVKSQIHAGGRGKGTFKSGFQGGVKVAASVDEAVTFRGKDARPDAGYQANRADGRQVQTLLLASA
jgi:hypothetical protein